MNRRIKPMGILKKNVEPVVDPLDEAIEASANALNVFYAAVADLDAANDNLAEIVAVEEALIRQAQDRVNAAKAQIVSNDSVKSKIDQILS